MPVVLAQHYGFCGGVKRAIAMAEQHLASQGTLVALGPLVHNEQLMERLGQQGLQMINDPDEICQRPTIVRSHGVGPVVMEKVRKNSPEVIDATCPSVQRIFDLAQGFSQSGHQVIIVGEKGHPEVEAACEWAGSQGMIIDSVEEAKVINCEDRVAVLAQSTLEEAKFTAVVDVLKGRGFHLDVVNTICTATRLRQEAAVQLAAHVDLMVVVGGRHSANTRHLVELCRVANPRTHFIEQATELQADWIRPGILVGVTAGASTPDWIIKEVEHTVSELEKKDEAKDEIEEVVTPEEGMPEDGYLPRRLTEGEIIKATVVSIDNDGVMIDVGMKSEGVVPRKELAVDQTRHPSEIVKIGEEIEVTVIRSEDNEGRLTFSKKRADQFKNWDTIAQAHEEGRVLTGRVTDAVKGGLVVDIGMRAFMPASLVDRRFVSDMSTFVGQEVQVKVVEMEKERRNVIVSRKAVLDEEGAKAKEALWATIQEGEIHHGVVRRLTDFGAFVDLGGVDGLLHISDISYARIKHPSEVVNVGDELDLMVLRLDHEKGRISLGLKQTQPEPWIAAAEEIQAGDIVEGKVVRITPWGAFVNVKPGLDGLVHISELANHRVVKVEDVVNVGDQVKVKVLDVNVEKKRLSLSLRALVDDQEKAEVEDYLNKQSE